MVSSCLTYVSLWITLCGRYICLHDFNVNMILCLLGMSHKCESYVESGSYTYVAKLSKKDHVSYKCPFSMILLNITYLIQTMC